MVKFIQNTSGSAVGYSARWAETVDLGWKHPNNKVIMPQGSYAVLKRKGNWYLLAAAATPASTNYSSKHRYLVNTMNLNKMRVGRVA